MIRLTLLIAFLAVASFFVLTGIGELPQNVAVNFDANGVAIGWISRDEYQTYILLFLVGAPLLLFWLMADLPRLINGKGMIPNCEYWFAPERRQTTVTFLMNHACWLGAFTVAVIYGGHISILKANALTPPALATNRVTLMGVIYLCGLAWWTTTLMRTFSKSG